MFDPKLIDDLAKRVQQGLPAGIPLLQEDLRKNLRSLLESALARMDLVTREEFEVQAAVLARTRAKLEQLEQRVDELETQAASSAPAED